MKIYKNRNPNIRRLSLLFVFQVILGLIPAVTAIWCVVHFWFMDETVRNLTWFNPEKKVVEVGETWTDAAVEAYNDGVNKLSAGMLFIAVIMFSFAGYIVSARKYNILASGYKGERLLRKIVRNNIKEGAVFINLPIRYKKNRSEIDMLIISRNGIVIIEVKNHSGTITGNSHCEQWMQKKYFRSGKITELPMRNPFFQVKRQREILKNVLRSGGYDIWIDEIVFFSNPFVKLLIDAEERNNYFSDGKELIRFVLRKKKKTLTEEDMNMVIGILRNF